MVVVAPPDSTNARKLAESGSCRGLLVVSQKGVSSLLGRTITRHPPVLRACDNPCGFWYVCRWVIFVLSLEGSGDHRRAFGASTVKIPGRLLSRSIAG